jgi:hypothetical protein
MKSCPSCNRIYTDNTLTYCLEDGAILVAAYDPQSTLQIPAARATEPPATEILRDPLTPGSRQPLPQQAAMREPTPFSYPRGAVAENPPQNPSGKMSKAVMAIIGVLAAGVLVLGYMLWRNNQSDSLEASKSNANAQANNAVVTPTAQTNNSVNVNAGGEARKPTGGQSSQWLEGVWKGTGYQKAPEMTWSIKFTAENNTYTIEYPSLRCGGKWTLVEMNDAGATFKETITRGLDKCSNGGDITVEKISDHQISYKYTLPIIGEVASATLSKEAMP